MSPESSTASSERKPDSCSHCNTNCKGCTDDSATCYPCVLAEREEFDGLLNPIELIQTGWFLHYLLLVPLTTFITQPGSWVQISIEIIVSVTSYIGSFGSWDAISHNGVIPALALLYIFFTYTVASAASDAGEAAAGVRDDNYPRMAESQLTGLPQRLNAAYHKLREKFPAFALMAALVQILAPEDEQLVNLLGLFVLLKIFLYYPAYLCDLVIPRMYTHDFAMASIINIAWRLACGAA